VRTKFTHSSTAQEQKLTTSVHSQALMRSQSTLHTSTATCIDAHLERQQGSSTTQEQKLTTSVHSQALMRSQSTLHTSTATCMDAHLERQQGSSTTQEQKLTTSVHSQALMRSQSTLHTSTATCMDAHLERQQGSSTTQEQKLKYYTETKHHNKCAPQQTLTICVRTLSSSMCSHCFLDTGGGTGAAVLLREPET